MATDYASELDEFKDSDVMIDCKAPLQLGRNQAMLLENRAVAAFEAGWNARAKFDSVAGGTQSAKRLADKDREKHQDAIADAERTLCTVRDRYLLAAGWEYTCKTPGCRWMWEKRLPDGRTIVTTAAEAMWIEDNL